MSERHPEPELSVVMPVYNESAVIREVLESWARELDALNIDFELRIYDDGSTDCTWEVVRGCMGRNSRIVGATGRNAGHGPTILRGYREARAPWVFQVDSDNEMPASSFRVLWEKREDYDFLIGWRAGRQPPLPRRIVARLSRLTVRVLFGTGLRDVNSPYRLMRTVPLRGLLAYVPPDTFAPNVILSGLALRHGLRICEEPVPHLGRKTGTVSIAKWRLWRAAFRSFRQTVAVAFRR